MYYAVSNDILIAPRFVITEFRHLLRETKLPVYILTHEQYLQCIDCYGNLTDEYKRLGKMLVGYEQPLWIEVTKSNGDFYTVETNGEKLQEDLEKIKKSPGFVYYYIVHENPDDLPF